jgi:hypothetical protein
LELPDWKLYLNPDISDDQINGGISSYWMTLLLLENNANGPVDFHHAVSSSSMAHVP